MSTDSDARPNSALDVARINRNLLSVTLSGSRWYMLAVLFVARAAMGFQFQSIATSSSWIAADLHLDPGQSGMLIGLYMLPGVLIALPGGLLTNRFGEKSTCLFGLALMVIGGLITAAATSTGTLAAGRAVSGSGAVIFNLVLTSMVVTWFAGREIVTALAIILASWPCSIAAALIAETALAGAYGWHAVMGTAALLATAAFLLVAVLYRAPPPREAAPSEAARPAGLLTARELAASSLAGAIWGAFNAGLVVFYSFSPPMLAEHGWRPLDAGSITSLGLWISMISLPIGGWLVETWGRPSAGILLACVVAGVAMTLLSMMVWPWGLSLLVGLGIGPGAGAIVALPSRAVAPARRPVSFGVFYTAYYAVMAVGPTLAGLAQTTWGTAAAGLDIGGALFLTGVPLLTAFELVCRTGSGRHAKTMRPRMTA
jgi:predicted MFS family arabinose efflux permease